MENEKELTESIKRLEKAVKRSNSLGWTALKGIFNSLGWVIGLAAIATITIYVLQVISDGNALGRFLRAMSEISKNAK